MAFEIPKQPYSGRIGEATLGTGEASLTVGGQDSYPFHLFEGAMPNSPKIAMEVWDYDPSGEWPAAAVEPFKDVISSPEAWAKKCVEDFGADLIVLQLKSTDPNGMDRSAGEAVKVAEKVLDAIDVPLVVWGTANSQKDEDVLKIISEACEGRNISLAPVEEANHKGIGASSLGYGHCIVASSPIDVNLAKQLNVLLSNLGVSRDKIIIDPTTGGLGYGLEYTYSVMERIRMAALTQEDDKLQNPLINNIGNEVWRCKEAGQSTEEAPAMGDSEKRAVSMEIVAAVAYLMAGSDVLVLRHPESVRVIRSFIDIMVNGGSASGIPGIDKRLESTEVDLVALSPEPDLNFAADIPEKPVEPPKKKAPAAKKPEPKAEKKAEAAKPPPPEEEKTEPAMEKVVAEKPVEEKRAERDAETKAAEEADLKARAEDEKKAAAEAEARAKAEAEEKAREKEQEKETLRALRAKRAGEKDKIAKSRKAGPGTGKPAEAPGAPLDLVEQLIRNLARFHRRR